MEQDFIQLEDERLYFSADSSYADDRIWVLNHADTFGVFNRWGDIQRIGPSLQGIYHRGMRHLSQCQLKLNGQRPVLLSSTIKEENETLTVDLINPPIDAEDRPPVTENVVHIHRSQFIRDGVHYETMTLENFDHHDHMLELEFAIAADFKDIFEIRGFTRKAPRNEPQISIENNRLCICYEGVDGQTRRTIIESTRQPDDITCNGIVHRISIAPREMLELGLNIQFLSDTTPRQYVDQSAARKSIRSELQKVNRKFANVKTSNEQFNHWVNRSKKDLVSLLARTSQGFYPYAGVPWFNTAFGRDGIITAYEVLWLAPEIAKNVLHFLAETQADTNDRFKDAEPGKILHETREGELMELAELPFKKYYGTIDATPLFVLLAGAYYQRTADKTTLRQIWPNIKAALRWIDEYGDQDGDGYVEYHRKSDRGLVNQGWKDSRDAVSHADGRLAEPPIALCEVQGYVFQAKRFAADMAESLNEHDLADALRKQARQLQSQFVKDFWDEELQSFVEALDGQKQACRIKTSNAGQCLFTGIATREQAIAIKNTLLQPDMYSGWGIRTLASGAARFNPMSYHNGSIWPHDNALVAAGLARYGFQTEALVVMSGLFDASLFINQQRLPELFCGFERRPGEGPTAYPVACSPQAWSVGTVFLLLQSCLGIEIDAVKKRVILHNPNLPDYIDSLSIENLLLGDAFCELHLHRHKQDVGIYVKSKPEQWQVMTSQ